MIGKRILPLFLVPCVVMVLLLVFMGQSAAQTFEGENQQPGRLAAAVNWLITTHQNSDAGFSAFSAGADLAPSDVGGTVDAVLAIAAAGYNPDAPPPGREAAPLDYLRNNPLAVAEYAGRDGGTAGKLILALTAAGENPRDFLGYNLVISLTNHISPTGQYGVNTPFEQSLAMLALNGLADEQPAEEAVAWLLAAQETEGDLAGSWDDGFGTAGNPDATAMAIMALLGNIPADDPAIVAARDFLARFQLPAGGWEYGPGLGANANSTALVVQALSALGEDFYSGDSNWAVEGVPPLATLIRWQGTSGAFRADFGDGPFDDFFTTVQGIPALAGRPHPLPGRFEAASRAVTCLATLQDPNTAGWESFPGGGVDAGGTARAIKAIAAFGADPAGETFTINGVTPLDALAALAPSYLLASGGGRSGTLLQGVMAAGGNPTDLNGLNLVISTTNALSPTGEYDDTSFGPFAHNQAMLGLISAGAEVDPVAIEWLLNAQTEGGWGDVDGTASSVQVLALLDRPVDEALLNLRALQLADGGWGFADSASPNSTSEVVQALILAGENPFSPAWSVVISGTVQNPAGPVLALQGEDGCWPNLFGPGNDPFSTVDGILLLVAEPPFGDLTSNLVQPVAEATEAIVPTATGEVIAPTATTEAIAATATTEVVAPTATVEGIAPTATSENLVAEAGEAAENAGDQVEPAPVEELTAAETGAAVNPIFAWVLFFLALAGFAGAAMWYRSRP